MSEQKNNKEARRRPPWLKGVLTVFKYTWFPISCLAAIIIGLTIGYVYLGHQPFSGVFHITTWRHLYDLIFAAG